MSPFEKFMMKKIEKIYINERKKFLFRFLLSVEINRERNKKEVTNENLEIVSHKNDEKKNEK